MVLILLYIVHIVISLFLIAVVLLQQGKGADLSVFGGGGTMTAFGARGAATLLHKLTVTSFILFIVTTMSIGAIQRSLESSSVMSGVPAVEEGAVATGDDDAATRADDGAIGADGAPALEAEPVTLESGDDGGTVPDEAIDAGADGTEDAGVPGEDGGA